jgi:dihydrofolate synthase/folylpolyglutamate synthase
MDYKQAIKYIADLLSLEQIRPGLPGLKRMRAFLSYYNSPQDSFMSFHVAGTNGKGSTVVILDSILLTSNLKIGRFTGPHLLRINERFHINGQPISDDEFAELVFDVKQKSAQFASVNPELGDLSWFEFLTALAFFYFAKSEIDIAVIEVGVGGRFDATNVLQKLYAIGITNIGLDHQNILGSKLEDIAMEKAGIIKPEIPVITAAAEPALRIISHRAAEVHAKLVRSNEQYLNNSPSYLNILPLIKNIKKDLYKHGLYQYQNVLTAICMLNESHLLKAGAHLSEIRPGDISLTAENVLEGIKNFYWPGRFQIIESEKIILDGAHNPAGIKALRESLDYLFPGKQFHFIFGCYHDKDGLIMLFNLLKPGDNLYLVDVMGRRSSFSLSKLAEHASVLGAKTSIYNSIAECLTAVKKSRSTDEFIIATGSFALLTLIMQNLGWTSVESGKNN